MEPDAEGAAKLAATSLMGACLLDDEFSGSLQPGLGASIELQDHTTAKQRGKSG